jgi:hypothetical protein
MTEPTGNELYIKLFVKTPYVQQDMPLYLQTSDVGRGGEVYKLLQLVVL